MKFTWRPKWVWLLIVVPHVGLLGAIVASILTRRNVTGVLPFSSAGWSRHRRAMWMINTAALVVIVATLVLLAFFAQQRYRDGVLTLVIGIGAALTTWLAFRGDAVQVMKITDKEIFVRIASETSAAEIRARLSSTIIQGSNT